MRFLIKFEVKDFIQQLSVPMKPYGIDDGTDIPLHTPDGCLIAGGYLHVESLGYVGEQVRLMDGPDYSIDNIPEAYVGIVDAQASKQVTGFSFVFHDNPSQMFDIL